MLRPVLLRHVGGDGARLPQHQAIGVAGVAVGQRGHTVLRIEGDKVRLQLLFFEQIDRLDL